MACLRWKPWLHKASNNVICSCCIRVWYSASDYGLGLTTLSHSTLLKLDGVQNEAMRVILETGKDTPIEAMRYLLDLPSPWKQDISWSKSSCKAYLNAMQNPKNPLHDAFKGEQGWRLAKDKSQMGQAELSTQHVWSLAELKQVRDWGKKNIRLRSSPTTRLCSQRT